VVRLKILRHHLVERLDVFLQCWSSEFVWQAVADARSPARSVEHQDPDRLGFVSRVAPRVGRAPS